MNKLSFKELIIYGNTIENFYYLPIITPTNTKIILYKKNQGMFKPIHEASINIGNIEEELFIISLFKNISCPICYNEYSASIFTQTSLGNICWSCWQSMNHPDQWKQLDNLELYLINICNKN